MTSRVHVKNDDQSNPAQHLEVTVWQKGSPPVVTRLAPGETMDSWCHDSHTVVVKEIGYPKQKEGS